MSTIYIKTGISIKMEQVNLSDRAFEILKAVQKSNTDRVYDDYLIVNNRTEKKYQKRQIPTRDYLMNEFKFNRSAAHKWIDKLTKAGYLEVIGEFTADGSKKYYIGLTEVGRETVKLETKRRQFLAK